MAYDSRGVDDFRASGVHAALLRADRHHRSHRPRPEFGASRLFEKLIEENRNIIEQVKHLQPDAKQ